MRPATHARAYDEEADDERDRELLDAAVLLRSELYPEPEENLEQVAQTGDITASLFPEQRAVLADPSLTRAIMCPRRAGKTHVLCVLLVLDAMHRPDGHAVYITLTQQNAEELIWQPLKDLLDAAGIAYTASESKLRIRFPDGGRIRLVGADNRKELRKLRGHGYTLVVVDECGEFDPALLEDLRVNVVEPALTDHGGRQVYAGTPGHVLDGPWYEMTGPHRPVFVANDGAYHHWTAKENVAVPGLWERQLAMKAANGWADDHPTWVREYLGRWVQDSTTLVYPYDPARNAIAGLPTHTPSGRVLEPSGWRHVLGADVGYVHACAFVLVACHELDPHDYVLSSEAHGELLPDGFASIVAGYLERIPGLQVVVDTGGMGKIHAAWTSLRERLPIWPADKRDKPSAIRDLRGRLLAGRVKILDGQQNAVLRGEMGRLGWCPKRLHHAEGQADHACDGLLYALRRLRNLGQPEPIGAGKPPELVEEERFIAELEERVAGGGRPWWDR